MGWVILLYVLLLAQPLLCHPEPGTLSLVTATCVVTCVTGQLWGPEPWEPERRAKSLAFLGKDEIIDNNSVGDTEDDDDKQTEEDAGGGESAEKKAILNVSDKDSPYALIDKYFPERESYFYQNRNKFLKEYRDSGGISDKFNDIGDLDPSEVWLSDDSLLVLKGGSTPNRNGFDNPWRPIDDFEAPYREPVLPPADFDPDTLDIGVGVPIETILAERANQERLTTTITPKQLPLLPPSHNSLVSFTESERSGGPRRFSPEIQSIPDPLKPYKDEVDAGHQEFKQFLDDVSKFISDMENFHSVKQQSASKNLIRTQPAPPTTTPTTTLSSPSSPSSPSSAYPISYSSPHGKVFLSTNYISHSSTPHPNSFSTIAPSTQSHRQQARSTRNPPKTSPRVTTTLSTTHHHVTSTVSTFYKERSSTTSTTSAPSVVNNYNYSNDEQEDWTPVTTVPSIVRKYNREDEFKSVVKQLPPRPTVSPAPVIHHTISPSVPAHVTTSSHNLVPASPTPYSLFQSVPENFQETDVFHLSQNVDFGKKLGVGAGPVAQGAPGGHGPISRAHRPQPSPHNVAYNEVDTGNPHVPGPPYKGRYSVHVTTKPPQFRPHHPPPAPPPPPPAQVAGVSLDSLLPALFTGHRSRSRSRSRSTIRRRRPKYIAPVEASDRQGNGDVRYVSFFSGGHGGNSWGYSYKLG